MGNSVQFFDGPASDDESDGDESGKASASAEEWQSDEDDQDDVAHTHLLDASLPTATDTACGSSSAVLQDLEDLGAVVPKRQGDDGQVRLNKGPKKMLNPSLAASLTKQGYKLVGSHSGVKLCRWTKAMLRGRGGCYKHTFYGIASYQCMEATPSLACANKCVFCWRHHKNPVGTSWRYMYMYMYRFRV